MSHAWMPASPCGTQCLTGDEDRVGRFRAATRLVRAIGVLLAALVIAPFMPIVGRRRREGVVRWAFRSLLRAFGVRLTIYGEDELRPVPGRGALVVNNHISWLDIVAINAVQPMRALAKSEVKDWPMVGRLSSVSGSVYVDRERLRSLPGTVAELAEVLRNGSQVNATPEGTTWCGKASGRFRTAAFQSALDAGVPVIPIALRFRMADGRETTAPAFIGDETLIDSLRRVARLRGLVMEMHILPPISPSVAANRKEFASIAEAAISSALGRVHVPAQRRRRIPDLTHLRQHKPAV